MRCSLSNTSPQCCGQVGHRAREGGGEDGLGEGVARAPGHQLGLVVYHVLGEVLLDDHVARGGGHAVQVHGDGDCASQLLGHE